MTFKDLSIKENEIKSSAVVTKVWWKELIKAIGVILVILVISIVVLGIALVTAMEGPKFLAGLCGTVIIGIWTAAAIKYLRKG